MIFVDAPQSGAFVVTGTGLGSQVSGIKAVTDDANSPIDIVNSGDLTAIGTGAYSGAYGIQARASARTSCPCASSVRTRLFPSNPVLPVTNASMSFSANSE